MRVCELKVDDAVTSAPTDAHAWKGRSGHAKAACAPNEVALPGVRNKFTLVWWSLSGSLVTPLVNAGNSVTDIQRRMILCQSRATESILGNSHCSSLARFSLCSSDGNFRGRHSLQSSNKSSDVRSPAKSFKQTPGRKASGRAACPPVRASERTPQKRAARRRGTEHAPRRI